MHKNQTSELTLLSDSVFKYFIKKEETRKWFYDIIKAKTGIDLEEYELIDNEENIPKLKDYRMDIVYKKENTIVIVEMNQFANEVNEIKGYQYLYRLAGRGIEEGQEYKEIHTKLIEFNNYRNRVNPEITVANYKFIEKEYELVREEIESYEIYVENYHKMEYNKLNEIDKRLWLMGAKGKEEMESVKKDKMSKKMLEELVAFYESPEFIYMYDNELHQKKVMNTLKREAYEEGHAEGEKSGEYKNQLQVVKNMIENNFGIEMISKITGLTEKEIKKMLNSI